jgi:hypothetical protein
MVNGVVLGNRVAAILKSGCRFFVIPPSKGWTVDLFFAIMVVVIVCRDW